MLLLSDRSDGRMKICTIQRLLSIKIVRQCVKTKYYDGIGLCYFAVSCTVLLFVGQLVVDNHPCVCRWGLVIHCVSMLYKTVSLIWSILFCNLLCFS